MEKNTEDFSISSFGWTVCLYCIPYIHVLVVLYMQCKVLVVYYIVLINTTRRLKPAPPIETPTKRLHIHESSSRPKVSVGNNAGT